MARVRIGIMVLRNDCEQKIGRARGRIGPVGRIGPISISRGRRGRSVWGIPSSVLYFAVCILIFLAGDTGAQGPDPGAAVVINELMAANASIVRDQQSEYDDWVELYNTSDAPVDVGGMYLTDDPAVPTKWRIPVDNPAATTIEAHGYLLIWTDNDAGDDGLHAGFRLNDDGEQVALFAADGMTPIDSLSFGAQQVDISYGRYPDGGPDLRFMVVPTPGSANIAVYEGITAEPKATPGSRLCYEPIQVTLTTETEDATIYYTFDGSDPFSPSRGRPTGSIYTGPLRITGSVTVKAVAWRPGWRQSPVHAQQYTFIGADLRNFSSPLPIGVIDTSGKGVSRTQVPAHGYFFNTGPEGRATLTAEIDFGGRAGINVRGKSSEGFPKHQYHLETWDEDNEDIDVSILGFPAESDWVLQGPYSDKALMRNVLAYRWSNEIGQYAPRTRFMELFLNTNDTSVSMEDYIGVYVFMEKIKIGPNRVDIAQIGPGDNSEPQITGGYIFKKDKFDGDDVTFNTSRGQRLIYNDPNGHDLTLAQRGWVRDFVNTFEAALYGAGFTDPVNGYRKFIDVDSFIDHHIIVELTKNIDGFRLSTYMFKDRNGKLHMGPVWDYNLSLGNADYLDGWNATGWYNRLLGDGDYPYWRRLFQDPEFQLAYADRWFEVRRDTFTTDRLLQMVEDYATLLEEPQARNFDRWRILGRYVWPNWFIAATFRQEINWMQGWLADRLAWMDSQIATEFAPAPPSLSQQGGHVDPGFSLAMSSPFGTVYYTLDGSDPRPPTALVGPVTGTVLVPENAPKRVLVPTGPVDDAWRGGRSFDDSAWIPVTAGPGGVGYERSSGYENYITLDLRAQMYNLQSTCYVRIPFAAKASVKDVDSVTLKVRYDDGFVAYLNGTEIARRNFAGPPAWDSSADSLHDDASAANFEHIEIPDFRDALRRGDNVLAIQGLNASTSSSDLLISVELTGDEFPEQETQAEATRYVAPIPINESTQVKARALAGGRWSALNEAVFGVGPVAESLRVSEIMYNPADAGNPDDPNTEYVELANIGAQTINLNLVKFTNGIDFTFPRLELAPGDYCLVVKDLAAFEAKYGAGLNVAGQYAGSLNNAGERIALQDAAGQIVQSFRFQDRWYDITDGFGFSLTAKDPVATDPNGFGDKSAWRPSADADGSPGFDDTGEVPELGAVVVNEVLANSVGGAPDWIELHNTTDRTIDIGGWFLSDDGDDLTKYQIAEGVTIAGGGYQAFYQDRHFGNEADPGCHAAFALSRNGETVCLHSGLWPPQAPLGDGALLTGYSEQEKFDASDPGVSLGRYLKSTGAYNFVALSEPTPGRENAYPQVGPVVIHEIMYHPDNPADAEYVELLNISDTAVTLYDAVRDAPWRFTDDPDNPGIELLFPAVQPPVLAPGEHLVLAKDLVLFNARFSVRADVQVLAWGAGNLANGSEKIQLSKPGNENTDGTRDWIRIDRVVYSDGSHPADFPEGIDPWPAEPDGHGASLTRIDPAAYGNDPANWHATAPSPGR